MNLYFQLFTALSSIILVTTPTIVPIESFRTSPTLSSLPRLTDFKSPTHIKNGTPWNFNLFEYEIPDPKLCMIMLVHPGASSIVYTNWTGTAKHCFRECEYDFYCRYSTYSNTLKKCIKTTRLEMHDGAEQIKEYYSQKWVSVRKKTAISLYFNSYCDSYNSSPKTCLTLPKECAWDRGPRGYNQNKYTQQSGYCGRIACIKSPVK